MEETEGIEETEGMEAPDSAEAVQDSEIPVAEETETSEIAATEKTEAAETGVTEEPENPETAEIEQEPEETGTTETEGTKNESGETIPENQENEEVTETTEEQKTEETEEPEDPDAGVMRISDAADFTYNVTDAGAKTIEITGYSGTDADVVIPGMIDGYTVTGIGENAFLNCGGLTSIGMPDSVTSIGDYAFGGCTGLTSIEIPGSVTSIGSFAFWGCSGLMSIRISEGLTSIGRWAFHMCSELTDIELPESLTDVGEFAFTALKLTSIEIPESVANMGVNAFDKSVVIYGESGNYAEKWAGENGNTFIPIKTSQTKDLSTCTVALAFTSCTYTGAAQRPGVTVKDGGTTLKNGTDYTVSYADNKNAGTATVTITGKGNYTGNKKVTVTGKGNYTGSKTVNFTIIKTVSGVKAASAGYNSVKVSWEKISGVTGYKVYRAGSKNGSYKCVKTVKGEKTTSYKDGKLTTGKTYYYQVRPYLGKKEGAASKAVSAKPVPAKAAISSVKNSASKTAKITWEKVSGASGYEIYSATSKNGKYKKVTTIKKGGTVSYKNTKLKKGKTYYYKVRAYRTVNGKKVYGAYSSVKSVKIKK